jgi:riboflavin synthase
MFTGIIEESGTVDAMETRAAGARLKVRCATVMADMTEGASIAVNGVCLTAVDLRPDSFSADLAPETLRAAIWAICAPVRASIWSVRSRPPAA